MKTKDKSIKKKIDKEERLAAERAMGEYPEIAEVLDIFLKLLELSGDTIPVNGKSISWDKLKEGFPVIDKRMLPKDLDPLMKRFKKIVGILLTGDGRETSAINAIFEKEELFRELLEGVLIGQYEFPEGFSHSKPVTLFAAGKTLLPLINGIKLSDPPKNTFDSWSESYCPICGAFPSISAIEGEENRLFLYCSRCAHNWNFPRLVCVHCGEEDQKKLQYFFAKDDEIHRVYVCDSCKHYIKSVDKREKPVVFPLLEDVTTMGLDIIAKREGYNRDTVDLVGLVLLNHEVKTDGQGGNQS